VKYISEYRDPAEIGRLGAALARTASGPIRLMEVCGTHTMAIFRFGLKALLPPGLELISGPGCPVCVTATRDVDRAVSLARQPGVTVASFGDMLRTPGSRGSLLQAKAEGGRAEVVYSTLEALDLARRRPDQEVVFLGIGFETTTPTVAASLLQAEREGLKNFSVLSCHKLMPPALEALLASDQVAVDGFLCPGHVTTVIGAQAYQPLAEKYGRPCVVAGFEPTDILQAVLVLVREIAAGRRRVLNQYRRGATWEGNLRAQEIMFRVFEPAEAAWRGLGPIPGSGLRIREAYARFDAARRFDLSVPEAADPPGCRCGEVLRGQIKPPDCPLFRRSCTPDKPVGPCMVSSEGTCSAYYKYQLD